ncbi:MAG: hypothetical protein MPN21_05780 [Thermoanaerobaculia bacterium]|nr:hypothetical protein [Thermoanaerobaculia bacterium]
MFRFRIVWALMLSAAIPVSALADSGSSPMFTAVMPDIVARSIELHGGDLFRRSEVNFQLCSRSGCAEVRVWRRGGRYEHEVEGRLGGALRRLLVTNDAVKLWTEAGESTSIAPEEEQSWRDAATSRMYHAFLPFRLADPSVRFADLGVETWGERELHRVAVGFEAGTSSADYDQWAFWFDAETARLEQFAYSYRGSPDGLRFRQLHRFRRVEGLLFADQVNLGWEGPGLSVAELSPESISRLREVSRVEFRELSVRILD